MQPLDPEGLTFLTEPGDGPFYLMNGETFAIENVPAGTRVLYPRPPLPNVGDLRAAIEKALDKPIGMDPLRAYLKPGMKVTVAFDDVSLALPLMRAPDCRQTALEVILDRLAAAGVDDVHLVVAVALHRHMHDYEVRHQVGRRIFNTYWHKRKLYNYDAEDKDDNIVLGHTDEGHVVELHKRSATSDLLIYVNLNLIALNGGHKSVGVGLATYRSIRAHHNIQHNFHSRSINDPPNSRLHHTMDQVGRYVEKHVKVFHLEMTVDTDTFPWYLGFLQKQEKRWNVADRIVSRVNKYFLDCTPLSLNRAIFFANYAPYKVTSAQAGECEAVHRITLENVYKQQNIELQGQSDIYIVPIPYVMPYSVHSVMNPILVYSMALGYMFNFYKGKPVLKEGGSIIFMHPLEDKFDPVHHPSYIELWEKLKEVRDPFEVDKRYADELATNERYIQLYRFHNAYHGFHPISMWNWGSHGASYCGQVIIVNPRSPSAAARLGWQTAPTLSEAIAMAKTKQGANASITLCHSPPIAMWEVK